MSDYPTSALACSWYDRVFEREHLIELLEEPIQIGAGTFCQGARVEVGDTGMYNVARLTPLTPAARAFLQPVDERS